MKKLIRNRLLDCAVFIATVIINIHSLFRSCKALLCGNKAEGYVDTAVKILIAVVIGALLLAGLYMLFGDTVLPALTEKIKNMFDYGG